MHPILETLIKKEESDFLKECEEIFSQNLSVYQKSLSEFNTAVDFSDFHPIARSKEEYFFCGYAAKQFEHMDDPEKVEGEISEIKKKILADKRAIKKNLKAGAYDSIISEESFNVEKIEEWLYDNEALRISQFPLFEALRPTTKAKYIFRELCYVLFLEFLSIAENDAGAEDGDVFMKYPMEFIGTPLFALSTGQAKPESHINQKKGTIDFYYQNKTSSGDDIKIYVGKDIILPENASEEVVEATTKKFMDSKAFGPFDFQVFVTFLNLITPDIVKAKVLIISIDYLMRRVGIKPAEGMSAKEKNNQKQYFKEKLIDSLNKFRDYDVAIQKESSTGRRRRGTNAYSLFITSYAVDYKDDNVDLIGKVRVSFSDEFLDTWMKAATEKVITQSWNALSSSARQFAFFLQRQRVLSMDTDYLCTIPLSDFMQSFPGKRKDFFLKELKESLEEYQKNAVIVDSYKIINNSVEFCFLPLNEQELQAYRIMPAEDSE